MMDPVDWTEERPGVWKPATPEDAQTLEDGIEAALRAAGLPGLAELREATGNG